MYMTIRRPTTVVAGGALAAWLSAASTAAGTAIVANAITVAQVGSDAYLFVDNDANAANGYEDVIKLAGVGYAGIVGSDII